MWLPMDDPRLENYKDQMIMAHIVRQRQTGDAKPEHLMMFARWHKDLQQWLDMTTMQSDGFVEWASLPETFAREKLSTEMMVAWDLGYPLRTVEDIMREVDRRRVNEAQANGAHSDEGGLYSTAKNGASA